MATATSARIERLGQELDAAGIDCFIGWDPVTIGYLHGFHEGAGERFMALMVRNDGQVRMICPALSEAQARRAGIENIRSWKDGENALDLFGALAGEWDLESGIVAVDANMPARMLLQLQSALPAALFRNGEEFVSSLMRRKDEGELALMRKAAQIADETWNEVYPKLRAGMTEVQVSRLLSDGMAKRGGKPTFTIVAAGRNGAEPHHFSDETPLAPGDVVILDFGCDVGGYQSDITRTVAIEHASEDAQHVYKLVYDAHMAGREAIRPGVPCEQIDAAARRVIDACGYGPQFFHRLGHGIGMNGHEHPNMVAGNTDRLEPGNCFSIEPGIYLEGDFGVRIENIVTCTDDGHESLNDEPSATLLVVGA